MKTPTHSKLTKLAFLALIVGVPLATAATAQSVKSNGAGQSVNTPEPQSQTSARRPVRAPSVMRRANRISRASNELGGRVLASLVGPNGDKGAFISPHGISSALDLLAFGAAGESRTALQKVLNPSRMGPRARARGLRRLNRSLAAANSADLQTATANAVWLRKGLVARPAYRRTARYALAAEIASVDFASPDALAKINGWSSSKTRRLIPEILTDLDPSTELVLTNATYFKGKWATAFAAELTEPKPFTRPDGTTRSVPMMSARFTTGYASAGDFHAVALPYRGDRFRMIVLTARDPAKSADVWRELAGKGIGRTLAALNFSTEQVDVSLPRFRAEFTTELQPVLAGLGLGNALDGKLDYSRLANAKLTSMRVAHRAVVDVNEAGTEAAAVTAIVGARSIEGTLIEFNADRPFLTAIVDRRTGTVLFLGYIVDP